jgi:hypothetical protein
LDTTKEEAIADAKARTGLDDLPINIKNGKRCIRIHADFLTDDEHVEHRRSMLTTTGLPGEFSRPKVEVPDRRENTRHLKFDVVVCQYNHPIEKCRCHLPIYSAGEDEKICH